MNKASAWKPRRYLILALVLILHAALITLFLSLSHQTASKRRMPALEVFFLPSKDLRKITPDSGLQLPSRIIAPSRTFNAISIALPKSNVSNPISEERPKVDWVEEARRTAESAVREKPDSAIKQESNSVQAPSAFVQPNHYKGEQTRLDTGQWMVWINEHCYQITSPSVDANGQLGSLPETVCARASKNARGDLFKDLPSYIGNR